MTSNDESVDADPGAETAIGPPAADETELMAATEASSATMMAWSAAEAPALSAPHSWRLAAGIAAGVVVGVVLLAGAVGLTAWTLRPAPQPAVSGWTTLTQMLPPPPPPPVTVTAAPPAPPAPPPTVTVEAAPPPPRRSDSVALPPSGGTDVFIICPDGHEGVVGGHTSVRIRRECASNLLRHRNVQQLHRVLAGHWRRLPDDLCRQIPRLLHRRIDQGLDTLLRRR